jgi:hypothetical protein
MIREEWHQQAYLYTGDEKLCRTESQGYWSEGNSARVLFVVDAVRERIFEFSILIPH